MSVNLDHLVIFAYDKRVSANFLAEMLALDPPRVAGSFLAIELSNGVTLDYAEPGVSFPGQHYAFLITEEEFDACLSRLQARGVEYAADPHWRRPGAFNSNDGGRGLYFKAPSGHGMEIITRRYGAGKP